MRVLKRSLSLHVAPLLSLALTVGCAEERHAKYQDTYSDEDSRPRDTLDDDTRDIDTDLPPDVCDSQSSDSGANCHNGSDEGPVISEAVSTLPRNLTPEISHADLSLLSAQNRRFAFDLYEQFRIAAPNDNLFYSPHSISTAFAMLVAGAREETASEINSVLRFDADFTRPDTFHSLFNALDLLLAAREFADADPLLEDGHPFTLRVSNSTWGSPQLSYEDAFLDILASSYGAGMSLLHFAQDPEAARVRINQWVEDQTHDLIRDLIPPGSIRTDTRLVLVNAIYFKANWLYPFEESNTIQAPFTKIDGSAVDVAMMRQHGTFAYGEVQGHQVLELPYAGNEVSLVAILPAEGQWEDFEAHLDVNRYQAFIDSLVYQEGHLELPRFSIDVTAPLEDALRDLGLNLPFSPQAANFSGITRQEPLFVSSVVHKAVVKVDEKGTEAAAATAIISGTTSVPVSNFDVRFNRPFVFVIRDRPTGAILFAGRVMVPE